MDQTKDDRLRERVPWIRSMESILREAGRKSGIDIKGNKIISKKSVEIVGQIWQDLKQDPAISKYGKKPAQPQNSKKIRIKTMMIGLVISLLILSGIGTGMASPPPQEGQGTAQTPIWAFAGAFENYTFTGEFNGSNIQGGYLNDTILSVEMPNITVRYTYNFTAFYGIHEKGNYTQTMEYYNFMAYNITTGQVFLSKGILKESSTAPGIFAAGPYLLSTWNNSQKTIKYQTPLGIYSAFSEMDVKLNNNGTYYDNVYSIYDSYSGILLGQNYSLNRETYVIGYYNITMILIKTNMPLSPPRHYLVRFTESGLSPGTEWSVSLNNVTKESVDSNITYSEVNGSYRYLISPPEGYTVAPQSGNVTVNGQDIIVSIVFTLISHPVYGYSVKFIETGLTNGSWSVTLINVSGTRTGENQTGGPIIFNVTNGSYNYIVEGAGKEINGSFTVQGANLTIYIQFKTIHKRAESLFIRIIDFLETNIGIGIIFLIVVVIALSLVFANDRKRKKGKNPPVAPQAPPAGKEGGE